jgi:Dirigent-like protein
MKRAIIAAGIGVLLIGGGVTYSAVVASANAGGVSVVPWHGVAATSTSSEVAPAITEPVTLRVTLGSQAFHFTDEDSNGRFSVGDVFSFTDRITSGGQAVGYDQVQCTAMFYRETLCTGAFHFTGRGDLEIAARVPDSRNFKIAITGGTGEFFNARGQALLTDVNNNTTRAVIYLVN